MNAGILPICKTSDGIRILLGKERSGTWPGASKWSAFEGGSKEGEKPERTAAREFFEETLGTLELHGQNTIDGIENVLLSKAYELKITITEQESNRVKIVYVVQVPFDEQIMERFNQARENAILAKIAASKGKTCKFRLGVRRDGNVHCSLTPHNVPAGFMMRKGKHIYTNTDFLEKSKITWWTVRDVVFAIYRGNVLRPFFIPIAATLVSRIGALKRKPLKFRVQ